ncbi:MAG TPA: hypothetical protein VI643_01490 [Planctomycetota bacterium]|nr:hypothetical protein [Planctomycetota bacterium]
MTLGWGWFALFFAVPWAVPQDPTPPTQTEIDKAIDRGAACLKKLQAADGSWAMGLTDLPSHRFKATMGPQVIGHTALMALTLLHADVDPDDPSIARALQFLVSRRAEYAHTYNCGIALMALDAFVEKKVAKLRRAPPTAENPPPKDKPEYFAKLPEEQRKFAVEITLRLVFAQLKDGSWTYAAATGELGEMGTGVRPKPGEGGFQPPTAPDIGGDLSNTQYALLGLRASSELGIAFDPDVWINSMKCLLERQERKIAPKIPGFHVPVAAESLWGDAKPGDRNKTEVSGSRKQFVPRGWGYTTEKARPESYGAMTAIGVAALSICKQYVRRMKEVSPAVRDRVDRAIEDGCSWLAVNFNVLDNAPWKDATTGYKRSDGKIDGYHMYSIERAGMLAGVKLFGVHDWYGVGARYLVDKQAADGSWAAEMFYEPKPTISTAFAVLFLKRATKPVIIETGDGRPPAKEPPK